MGSTYSGNYAGIGSMLRRPWMAAAVVPVAERMLAVAEGLSPTGRPPGDPHPGEYRASFKVVAPIMLNVPFRGKPALRVSARLVNTSGHAGIVEHGNGNTPRYAVLSRSIDAMKASHGL